MLTSDPDSRLMILTRISKRIYNWHQVGRSRVAQLWLVAGSGGSKDVAGPVQDRHLRVSGNVWKSQPSLLSFPIPRRIESRPRLTMISPTASCCRSDQPRPRALRKAWISGLESRRDTPHCAASHRRSQESLLDHSPSRTFVATGLARHGKRA